MAGDTDMGGWTDLLQSSTKLLEHAAPSAQFPPLQRDIGQLEALSKKLKSKTLRTETPSESIAATRLLAREGLNAEQLARDLKSFEIKTTYENVFPSEATTVDEYLQQGMAETSILSPEGLSASDDEIQDLEVSTIQNNKKRLRKDSDAGKKRGVCYLSRVPPHMDPTRLRQILSQYGDIHRIYLVPESPTVQVQRKQVGGFRGKQFSEGWVEFTRRSVAKKVANILNGEQIGGKRRSSFYYDIWNIKYLNKFKWTDLTTETANKNRTREQKLTMEISAAKRERDFYLKKVDQSKALKFMKERMNKKQKTRGESEHVEEAKVVRRFPQNRPVADRAVQNKPGLSKEVLKEVFGSSS